LIEAKFVELANFDPEAEPGDSPLRILPKDDAGNTPARVRPSKAETELRSKFPKQSNLTLESVSPPTVMRVLTEAQASALLERIYNRSSSDVLCPPKITSASGKQAQIQVTEMKTVVTGVETNSILDASGEPHPGINYLTENIPFGTMLDLVPRLTENDSSEIQLAVSACLTELIGYDDPGEFRISVGEPGAKPVKGVLPMPRVRLRELEASASLENGQTILLGGPVSHEAKKVKDKVPVLGDIPWLGRLFRDTHTSLVKKHLVILVKASLVDEKGDPANGTSAAAPPNP
jgi:general secretion pathway protein D